MALAQHLSVHQKICLRTETVQSLEILKMSAEELDAYLQQYSYDNPVVEIRESPADSGRLSARTTTYCGEMPLKNEPLEQVKDVAWNVETFSASLREQITTMRLDENFSKLCCYMVGCLNRRGYFEEDPEDIAAETGSTVFEVMQALYLIQSLSPAGVGARSLEECLVLQLAEGANFNGKTIRLVKNGLKLIAENNTEAVARLLACDGASARKYMEIVRSLNPIPSRGYNSGDVMIPILPDAAVRVENGHVVIELLKSSSPEISVNRSYERMMKECADESARAYLKEQISKVKTLREAIHFRRTALSRILREIAAVQHRFFVDGAAVCPMSMEQIAERCGLHCSTVSRGVQGKYLVCRAGTLAVRSLFVKGMDMGRGRLMTPGSIQQQLARFIAAEDPAAPLSDEDLAGVMSSADIHISRRTVAKYRSELNIPASRQRRR